MPEMPVPLPRMCSVLAHELRSPLSVLQGYIRLLQRQREPGHPEMAMLDAMLDATGRLTTIARQSSDLSNWLTGLQTRPLPVIPVGAVVDALADRLRSDDHVATLGAIDAPARERTLRADPTALAGAIVAVAESLHRDDESAVIEISVLADPPGDESTGFALSPRAAAAPATRPGSPRALSFDRGGSGLALVAASHIFDAHGASIDTVGTSSRIMIRLPHTGGTQ